MISAFPLSKVLHFARERYSDALYAEFAPLLVEHYAEVAFAPGIPVCPAKEGYRKLDEDGQSAILTARDAETGALVGYALFYIGKHPHHENSVQAIQDNFYLKPEYRQGFLGFDFLRFCDTALADMGVEVVHHTVTSKRDFGKVLERLGYKANETIYMKRLRG